MRDEGKFGEGGLCVREGIKKEKNMQEQVNLVPSFILQSIRCFFLAVYSCKCKLCLEKVRGERG